MRNVKDENLTLDQIVWTSAKELPKDWTIELHVENGAAWVELYDEMGEKVEVAQGSSNPQEAMGAALDMAKAIAFNG